MDSEGAAYVLMAAGAFCAVFGDFWVGALLIWLGAVWGDL